MSEVGNGNVTYSVKELLGLINQKLDDLDNKLEARYNSLDNKLENKADRIDMLSLVNRVARMEVTMEQDAGVKAYKRWIGPIVAGAAVGTPGVVWTIFQLLGK